jgi:LysM repeat protein
MGLFDMFGKSFEKKVDEAIATLRGKEPSVRGLGVKVEGKVVTLVGEAPDKQTKARVAEEFNRLIETGNTINAITLAAPPPAPAPVPAAVPADTPAAERIHEVKPGDTLGAIANHYYGKASMYMKIFEANRDQLDNPDLIKVGQKLRIPE